jgi:hypothetical protein
MIAKPQPVGLPAFLPMPKGRGFSRFLLNKAVTAEMQPDAPVWGNKPTAWAETLATLEKQKVEQAGETLGKIAV